MQLFDGEGQPRHGCGWRYLIDDSTYAGLQRFAQHLFCGLRVMLPQQGCDVIIVWRASPVAPPQRFIVRYDELPRPRRRRLIQIEFARHWLGPAGHARLLDYVHVFLRRVVGLSDDCISSALLQMITVRRAGGTGQQAVQHTVEFDFTGSSGTPGL